jgi:hypothetical protein
VAGALDGPLIVVLEEAGAGQAVDRGVVGGEADDFGATLDLAAMALDRAGVMQLGSVLRREGRLGQDVGFGLGQ